MFSLPTIITPHTYFSMALFNAILNHAHRRQKGMEIECLFASTPHTPQSFPRFFVYHDWKIPRIKTVCYPLSPSTLETLLLLNLPHEFSINHIACLLKIQSSDSSSIISLATNAASKTCLSPMEENWQSAMQSSKTARHLDADTLAMILYMMETRLIGLKSLILEDSAFLELVICMFHWQLHSQFFFHKNHQRFSSLLFYHAPSMFEECHREML